ncbi:MAG: N-acetylglucosamine kinase [Rhodobacteraceae bacterium]|jgi:N-acetylglucosamine kinase-like BadF-type ATPase|nr:N-acetylglucosamine kinase [Paracoccaceae bacterium]
MLWLGVDMGGTATRWVARDAAGAEVARGAVAGGSAVPDPTARAAFTRVLTEIAGAAPGRLLAATLGLTGAGLVADPALRADTAQALRLPEARVNILNDVVLAGFAAYPGSAQGHLIAAGTGSVAVHKAASGTVTVVGGRGILIDDAGSGAWIALQALRAIWRRIDASGAPDGLETLARCLFDALGGDEWEVTRQVVYGGDRGRIAALAPAVAEAARAGDAVALALLEQAGHELARLARALSARCGPGPVAAIGGVLALHPAVAASLAAALPDVTLTRPDLDAAAQAATMALSTHAPETP